MATLFSDIASIDFQKDFKWFDHLGKNILLDSGQLSPNQLVIPEKDAQKILSKVVRLVLDLPKQTTPLVVWSQGKSELLVHSDRTKIQCSSGVITIEVVVECDQHDEVMIPVPIGVGRNSSPSGLLMSAFSDLQGPQAIVETWQDALTAFAWETIIEIARVVSGNVGKDSRGLDLVPGSIGAANNKLLIQPVARYTLAAGD